MREMIRVKDGRDSRPLVCPGSAKSTLSVLKKISITSVKARVLCTAALVSVSIPVKAYGKARAVEGDLFDRTGSVLESAQGRTRMSRSNIEAQSGPVRPKILAHACRYLKGWSKATESYRRLWAGSWRILWSGSSGSKIGHLRSALLEY